MTGRILDPLENKRYLNKWCDEDTVFWTNLNVSYINMTPRINFMQV